MSRLRFRSNRHSGSFRRTYHRSCTAGLVAGYWCLGRAVIVCSGDHKPCTISFNAGRQAACPTHLQHSDDTRNDCPANVHPDGRNSVPHSLICIAVQGTFTVDEPTAWKNGSCKRAGLYALCGYLRIIRRHSYDGRSYNTF